LTLEEILSDSIVKAVMKADGIDPEVLEAELLILGHEVLAGRRVSQNNLCPPVNSCSRLLRSQ